MRTYVIVAILVVAGLPALAEWTAPPMALQPWLTESLAWTAAAHSENLALAKDVKATSAAKPVYASNVAAAAIDGNPKSEWATADPASDLVLEFAAPVRINGVSLVRDIGSEHPVQSGQGCIFTVDASLDGQKWETVADTGRYGARVVNWAVLFPEREAKFVRMHVTRLPGRVGEMGVFLADLTQAEKWGWAAPECTYRTPLPRPGELHWQYSLGVDLSLARGNATGVVLPQTLRVDGERRGIETEFRPADPEVPEVGTLRWGLQLFGPTGALPAKGGLTGPFWLYFSVGAADQVKYPTPGAGQTTLAVSTLWRNFVRSKPLALTVRVHAPEGKPLQGKITYYLEPVRGCAHDATRSAEMLATEPVNLPAGGEDKHVLTLNLAQIAAGDYLLGAALNGGDTAFAEVHLPVFVGPAPRPGMTFGIYSIPYFDGLRGYARATGVARDLGFTEVTGQYWGEGYNPIADLGLRQGLLFNPTIEPIYNQNHYADENPAAACTDAWGKRITWHPSTCYTHPDVVKDTETQAEQWIRDVAAMPGFGGYMEADDDVHLAPAGCYNESCKALFKAKTGLDVPMPSKDVSTQPAEMPAMGLIPDNQPWLLWYLFRSSDIRGNLPRIYEAAKKRVDPSIKLGAVRGNMQFPFYCPHEGEYPPLFDAQYDAPGSYAYLYWVRQTQDYICHSALAAMGNRGKERWMLPDFAAWPGWILEQGGDGRWQLALMKSLQEEQTSANLYPPGALNKVVWCCLAGGFKRIHMFQLPEPGARNDVQGTELAGVLQTWGARARAYGKLMTALQEPARPVAILTSISTSAFEPGGGLGHSGVTSQVLKDCLREHVPADMIAEEEILAGALQGRKVLLCPNLQWLRQSVNAAIEKWAAAGGIVITETDGPVQPQGSRAIKREQMAATAGQAIKRDLECDNPQVVVREYELDGVRYYYLVNVYTDRWSAGLRDDPWVSGDNSVFTELYTPRAQQARLRIPAKQAWDVFGNREYTADAEGNIEITVGPDDGVFLALYPQDPTKLTLKAPGQVKAGEQVGLEIGVKTADGKAVSGGVPVQITVTDPSGAQSEYSQYALATGGMAKVSFRTALNDARGKWKVSVKTLVGTGAAGAEVGVGG